MERAKPLAVHPSGNGGRPPKAKLDELLRSAAEWLTANEYSEVTIQRRGGIFGVKRQRSDSFEVEE